MEKELKKEAFEYLLDRLYKWYEDAVNENRMDFTRIKASKLLFLVASVKDEQGNDLLGIFDKFVTNMYGPTEVDVQEFITENKFQNYKFGSTYLEKIDNICWWKNNILSDDLKQRLDNAVKALQNKDYNLIKLNPFDLVQLTTNWDGYRICYKVGILIDKPHVEIPINNIREYSI